MRLSLGVRVALAFSGWLVATLAIWHYVATHDFARAWRQFLAGRGLPWPPPPKRGAHGHGVDLAVHTFGWLADVTLPAALIVAVALAALVAARLWHRRQRTASTATWELRLGRDDLANPYRVQEALEGILGAISARWYRRVWRGQDHIAFETHRLPDGSVRFTVAARRQLAAAIRGGLEDLYPDVELIQTAGRPTWTQHIVRLKKRHHFVLSLQTTRDYEHAFSESLVALLGSLHSEVSVQLVLTPAPGWVYRRARKLLKRRERRLNAQDRRDPQDPGMDSVVEAKELKGALETQHRSLATAEVRVAGRDPNAVRQVAGLFAAARSENELVRREIYVRRRLYARRVAAGVPNPLPSWRTGVLSTSELATLWQLPSARAKHAPMPRASVRRAIAPPQIERDPDRALMDDERGPVSIGLADRKYGHALMGGQNCGKSSVLGAHFANDARDPDTAIVVIDPKGPLAERCRGMAPAGRAVHYLDLGNPEIGLNPLRIDATPGTRADLLLRALIEANPPGAIQAASDSFLRQAATAVCAVETEPTLWHVYRMLEFGKSAYRQSVVERLDGMAGMDFARLYWRREFPALLAERGFAAPALNPPRNKLERLISTPEIDTVLRHPCLLDLDAIIERGEILIINGAKAAVGEDNAIVVIQLFLGLLHRVIQARQRLATPTPRRIVLLFDEVHNALTRTLATMLAEGRSAGLQAVLAWQYSQQIEDELVRSGVRSLVQSLSIFRMREMEDARSLAGLLMELYTDRITVHQDEQQRLRYTPEDITRLPIHEAINAWIAGGVPRSAFKARSRPIEPLCDDRLAAHHAHAQHQRGGHYPAHLRDPVSSTAAAEPSLGDGTATERISDTHADAGAHRAASPGHRRRSGRRASADTLQLPLELPSDDG
jgi:hypothetical protein